jgi:hypothetical protein
MFALVFAVTIVSYFTNVIVNVMPTFPANSQGNYIIGGNYSLARNAYVSGFNIINEGIVLITIFALVVDVIASYYDPDVGQGIVNIFLLFVMAVIWLVLKIGAVNALGIFNTLNAGNGVPGIAYTFFISPYFILIVSAFMVISTGLNFRHHPNNSGGHRDYPESYSDIRSTEGIR